jgi:hypothetical protein
LNVIVFWERMPSTKERNKNESIIIECCYYVTNEIHDDISRLVLNFCETFFCIFDVGQKNKRGEGIGFKGVHLKVILTNIIYLFKK